VPSRGQIDLEGALGKVLWCVFDKDEALSVIGDTQLSLTATIFHRRRRKIMTLEALILLKARTGIAALAFAAVVMPLPAAADTFVFNTGNPDGLMATATRPESAGKFEIETGDDFALTQQTLITGAAFTGLIPLGASTNDIKNVVVEVYRVFPADSNVGRTSGPPTFSTPNVPTRVNSPSDVALDQRQFSAGAPGLAAIVQQGSFTALNSVKPGGIHPAPNFFTGGNGPVTGQETLISVNFSTPFDLLAGQYFFVPQVELSSGDFFWLSAPRPIVPPGTPFPPGFTDLQSWTRDASNGGIEPDWLRIGTDITGQGPFNAAFVLNGVAVPGPIAGAGLPGLIAACGALLMLARRRRKTTTTATITPM
jgi:hypothetical protein